jgi:hypothetical protein
VDVALRKTLRCSSHSTQLPTDSLFSSTHAAMVSLLQRCEVALSALDRQAVADSELTNRLPLASSIGECEMIATLLSDSNRVSSVSDCNACIASQRVATQYNMLQHNTTCCNAHTTVPRSADPFRLPCDARCNVARHGTAPNGTADRSSVPTQWIYRIASCCHSCGSTIVSNGSWISRMSE